MVLSSSWVVSSPTSSPTPSSSGGLSVLAIALIAGFSACFACTLIAFSLYYYYYYYVKGVERKGASSPVDDTITPIEESAIAGTRQKPSGASELMA